MSGQELHVVTGAFGYSGQYIAARLLQAGHRVRTLTTPDRLALPGLERAHSASASGETGERCKVLRRLAIRWVRFNYGDFVLT
jgi:NADH dehydrogenase